MEGIMETQWEKKETMKDATKQMILNTTKKLTANYEAQEILSTSLKSNLPDRQIVYSIIEDLHKITFP